MTKTKKYDYRAVQDASEWTAEIIRRVTSTKVVVSKSQSGFSSESEALKWGNDELKTFLLNLKEKNKRHAEQREKKIGKTPSSESTKESSEQ